MPQLKNKSHKYAHTVILLLPPSPTLTYLYTPNDNPITGASSRICRNSTYNGTSRTGTDEIRLNTSGKNVLILSTSSTGATTGPKLNI